MGNRRSPAKGQAWAGVTDRCGRATAIYRPPPFLTPAFRLERGACRWTLLARRPPIGGAKRAHWRGLAGPLVAANLLQMRCSPSTWSSSRGWARFAVRGGDAGRVPVPYPRLRHGRAGRRGRAADRGRDRPAGRRGAAGAPVVPHGDVAVGRGRAGRDAGAEPHRAAAASGRAGCGGRGAGGRVLPHPVRWR